MKVRRKLAEALQFWPKQNEPLPSYVECQGINSITGEQKYILRISACHEWCLHPGDFIITEHNGTRHVCTGDVMVRDYELEDGTQFEKEILCKGTV